MKEELKEILADALAAAESGRTVRRFLSIEDGRTSVGGESFEPRRVLALAIGKASGAMARAAEEVLGEALNGGLCVVKAGHENPPPTFETLVASHPQPDERSARAAEKVEEFLEELEEGDLLLVLISGGASALLADTAPGIALEDVRQILERYEIEPPQSVWAHLEGEHETPKPGDTAFEKLTNIIVGGGRLTAEAAAKKAGELGYEPILLSTYLTGDAREMASFHAAIVKEILESGNPLPTPCALVTGGEGTTAVRGEGMGGPNQEFALALALELEGVEAWAALAVDTDGADGPTDAAGGLVTGETAAAIREHGVDPRKALDESDSCEALRAGQALISTGPTGTNVNDLRVMLVSGSAHR